MGLGVFGNSTTLIFTMATMATIRHNVFTIKIIIKTSIRKMSDSEPEQTTTRVITKEKKPRSEAQKQATARALEALAEARKTKAEAKLKETRGEQVVAKRTTTTTRIVKPKVSKPKPVPEPVVPTEAPKPIVNNYDENLSRIMGEMASLKDMISNNKPKKVVKRKVVIEESSSDEEEEVVIRKKKTKAPQYEPAPMPPPPATDNRHLLEQIFFRNH